MYAPDSINTEQCLVRERAGRFILRVRPVSVSRTSPCKCTIRIICFVLTIYLIVHLPALVSRLLPATSTYICRRVHNRDAIDGYAELEGDEALGIQQ